MPTRKSAEYFNLALHFSFFGMDGYFPAVDILIPKDTAYIQQNMRLISSGEGIAVDACPHGGGQFDKHSRFFELHCIISRKCLFVCMVVFGVFFFLISIPSLITGRRDDSEITSVGSACSAQTGVAETHDPVVGEIIS